MFALLRDCHARLCLARNDIGHTFMSLRGSEATEVILEPCKNKCKQLRFVMVDYGEKDQKTD